MVSYKVRAISKKVHGFGVSRSGAAGLIFGLAVLPILLAVGVAIDFQRIAVARSRLQHAADVGALAAATASRKGGSQAQRVVYAQSIAKEEFADRSNSMNAAFALSEASNVFTVKGTASVKLAFLKLVYRAETDIGVTSAAAFATQPGNSCMMGLLPAGYALYTNQPNGLVINAPGCEFDSAGMIAFGYGAKITASKMCVKASMDTTNGTTWLPSAAIHQLNCPQPVNPYASPGALPSVDLSQPCKTVDFSKPIPPGHYCNGGSWSGPGDVQLTGNGVYILENGTWGFGGNITVRGSNVTFYYVDGASVIATSASNGSGPRFELTAPTSGTYAGILMYEAPGIMNGAPGWFVCSGRASPCLSGLIYTPSRWVYFGSADPVNTMAVNVVGYAVNFPQNLTWNISPSQKAIPTAGGSGAGTVRLVQ